MADRRRAQLDLAELLVAVENAPPVAAADVLGERLAETFGASGVSLLVADLSGRALIRLGHAASDEDARTQGRETAERVPLTGTSHGVVLASQSVVVEDGADGARVFAPVTNRGEAIGVLELTLAEAPDEPTLADVALAAHASPTSSSPTAGSPTSSSGASAPSRSRSPPKSSTVCSPTRSRARPGSSRSPPGWNPRARSPATPSTSRWSATRCTSR
jgi:hypothetical protein